MERNGELNSGAADGHGYLNPWSAPPDTPKLEAGAVHIWRASLLVEAGQLRQLRELLSEDELCRAERFLFERDRNRFIAARGLLRKILGRYLDIEPSRLRFRYSEQGKPELAANGAGDNVHFNLSHSSALAFYAIAFGRKVGVDIEQIRADLPDLEIADRFFSPSEVAILRGLAPDRRREAFFRFWTLKEAYLKATGKGLTFGLNQVDVSSCWREQTAVLLPRNGSRESSRWWLQKLFPASDYAAGLAVEEGGYRLECWHLPLRDA
jgi:4'-phosphopantetheinyl transferase